MTQLDRIEDMLRQLLDKGNKPVKRKRRTERMLTVQEIAQKIMNRK